MIGAVAYVTEQSTTLTNKIKVLGTAPCGSKQFDYAEDNQNSETKDGQLNGAIVDATEQNAILNNKMAKSYKKSGHLVTLRETNEWTRQ